MYDSNYTAFYKKGKTIEKLKRKVVSRDSQEGEGEDT